MSGEAWEVGFADDEGVEPFGALLDGVADEHVEEHVGGGGGQAAAGFLEEGAVGLWRGDGDGAGCGAFVGGLSHGGFELGGEGVAGLLEVGAAGGEAVALGEEGVAFGLESGVLGAEGAEFGLEVVALGAEGAAVRGGGGAGGLAEDVFEEGAAGEGGAFAPGLVVEFVEEFACPGGEPCRRTGGCVSRCPCVRCVGGLRVGCACWLCVLAGGAPSRMPPGAVRGGGVPVRGRCPAGVAGRGAGLSEAAGAMIRSILGLAKGICYLAIYYLLDLLFDYLPFTICGWCSGGVPAVFRRYPGGIPAVFLRVARGIQGYPRGIPRVFLRYPCGFTCWLSTVNGQRSTVGGQRSAVNGRRSAVNGQRSTVGGQRSAVNGQQSTVYGRRPVVNC